MEYRTVVRTEDNPRDRLEAQTRIGELRGADPANADCYRVRYSTGGYVIVRVNHPDDAP